MTVYVCCCSCVFSACKVSLLMSFRSGTDKQYSEKRRLLGDIG